MLRSHFEHFWEKLAHHPGVQKRKMTESCMCEREKERERERATERERERATETERHRDPRQLL